MKQENQPGSLQAKLARFLLGYRNTPHPDTGRSPAFLLTGRPLHSMLDLLKPDSSVPVLKGPLPTVRFAVGQTVLARDYSVHGEKWLKSVITQRLGHYLFLLKVGDYLIKRHVDQMLPASSSKANEPMQREEVLSNPVPPSTPQPVPTPKPLLTPVPVAPEAASVPSSSEPLYSPVIEQPTAAAETEEDDDSVLPEKPEPATTQPIVDPVPASAPALRRSSRPSNLTKDLQKNYVLPKMLAGGV